MEAFVFLANFSDKGVMDTNATTLLPAQPTRLNPNWNVPLSSAFPTWPMPSPSGRPTSSPPGWPNSSPSGCSYISYHGNSLGRNFRAGPLREWEGGLEGGPLLLYPSADTSVHPASMMLSPLNHPKVGDINPHTHTLTHSLIHTHSLSHIHTGIHTHIHAYIHSDVVDAVFRM